MERGFVSLRNIEKVYPNGGKAVHDFNLEIEKNEFIVIVGPSGCGKSTTLRMVAGLEDITNGELYIDNELANFKSSNERKIAMVFQSYALYPQMTVYDNIAFPLKVRKYHKVKKDLVIESCDQVLKLLENKQELVETIVESHDKNYRFSTSIDYLATKLNVNNFAARLILKHKFSTIDELNNIENKIKEEISSIKEVELVKLKAKGFTINENYEVLLNGVVQYCDEKLTNQEIREKVFEAARILDLGPYLDRRPKELSGGQMQRVALGRAIVRNAKLFLMDEPLSNLDAKLRVQMRSEITRIHEEVGATTIYVTHDQIEAMTMANKIVVMNKGFIQQVGSPIEIYHHPKNLFVATFIGTPPMNILECVYDKGIVKLNNQIEIKLNDEQINKHDLFILKRIQCIKEILNKEYTFEELRKVYLPLVAYKNKYEIKEEKVSFIKKLFSKKIKVDVNDYKNQIILELKELLAEYEKNQNSPHHLKLGIRPEDIKIGKKGFNLKTSIVEILGSEFVVYCDDEIGRVIIKTNKEIKAKENICITLDNNKLHLFDEISEENMLNQ